ncbi:MAG: 3-deoxy-8-phosphooctulonate synthase [Parachlamydiales bacterium]|nr:3-deoxy-8-phosphooctulonate synthase [Parachlamydiales bacterium]
MKKIVIKNFAIGEKEKLTLMSGPCVIENLDHTLQCAEALVKITTSLPVHLIFKASYDKANRSSLHSFRGPGIEEGLKILQKVQSEFDLPLITDVHTPQEAAIAAGVCDMIQIPAFLCRQTDLLIAAGNTQKPINIKKGQFVAPWNVEEILHKVTSTGNENILLTDRGTCFGYNNLVADMRSIPIMQNFGYPVCFDASHSAQLPGSLGSITGGLREYIPHLAKAAIAAGANVLFIESHPTPEKAKSDSTTVMPYDALEKLLHDVVKIYGIVHEHSS